MKIDIDKTKQQENMQELTMMECNQVEDKQEESPIYDYLKEHPSIFISIISGFVVVVGFLFNCIIYTDECKYLEYWNLNKQLININSEHQIYELVITSFMFFGLIFVELFILNSVNRYFKVKKEFWETRILARKIKRKYRKTKKQIKKGKKDLIRKSNNGLIKEEIKNKELYVEELEEYLKRYKSGVREVKKRLNETTRSYNMATLLFSLFLIWGSGYIFFTMWSITVNDLQIFTAIVAIFCILWLLAYFGLWIGYLIDIHGEYKKTNVEEQFKKHIKSFDGTQKKEKYPIQKLFDFNLKNLLKKDNMIYVTIYFLFLLFIFIGWISTSKTNQIAQNKKFDIIEYEDTDYAIMYRDDKYFYLEEVRIQGNDLYIYINNQLRISSEGLHSVNREFDHAFRVSNEEIK